MQLSHQSLVKCEWITGKKAKELVYSGVHDWNNVWTKYFKKARNEEVQINDHGEYQQQSTQRLLDRYDHMIVERNGRIYAWNPSKRNIILLEIKKVTVNILYFAPLQFIRQERSVAPSIFNIKAQGLAHCLLWVKLS